VRDEQLHRVVDQQRRHRPDHLAADTQPFSARCEEVQRRTAAQKVLGDLGGRRDHVLAVVEHDQQLPVGENLREPARVGELESARDRRSDAGGVPDRGELDQNAPTRERLRTLSAGIEREPRLADSAGSHQRDEAVLVEETPQITTLAVPSDEWRERHRDRRSLRGDAWRERRSEDRCVECRVVDEDRALEAPELGPRLQAELVSEDPPALLEDPQCVRLTAVPVQREHEQTSGLLAEWMRGDERFELADRCVMAPEPQLEAESLLERREPELGEAVDLRRRELLVRKLRERVASPQRPRLYEEVDRRCRVTCRLGGACIDDELLETVHVDGLPWKLERVARAARRDQRRRSQRTAQLRHEALDPVARGRRCVVAPQRLDEVVGGHGTAHVEREHGQERAQLAAADGQVGAGIVTHLEISEQPDVHESTLLPPG
jgi:hypothetical protein